jgi:hypothetical protein
MLKVSEIISLFAPILIFFLIAMAVAWQIAETAEGKTRASTIIPFLFWIFLTLVFCVFTLSYLSPHSGGGIGIYFLEVFIYGMFGFGLVLLARHGKRKSQ